MGARIPGHGLSKAIVTGFLCFVLFGCQYDPWADGFLTTQPPDKDIVGIYKVDSDSLRQQISIPSNLKTLSISPDAEIVLSAEHKAQFVNVPESDDADSGICVISGSGSWEPIQTGKSFVVLVRIQRNDFRKSADGCQPTYDGEINLYGNKPPHKLTVTISDPDLGEVVQFEKLN